MSVPELLKKRLAEWEAMYDHELSEAELSIWYDTFRDLRVTDTLLEAALRIVQGKVVKMPKPGHLTVAIEDAREARDRENALASTSRFIEDMRKTPHISELPREQREEIKAILAEGMAKILAPDKGPHARTYGARIAEAKRQQDAIRDATANAVDSKPLGQTQAPSDSAPPTESPAAIAVEPTEPTPEDLAEEPPFEATDEDIPF